MSVSYADPPTVEDLVLRSRNRLILVQGLVNELQEAMEDDDAGAHQSLFDVIERCVASVLDDLKETETWPAAILNYRPGHESAGPR